VGATLQPELQTGQIQPVVELNRLARSQMAALLSNSSVKGLNLLDEKANTGKQIPEKETHGKEKA